MTIRGLLEKWATATPDAVMVKFCEDKVWKVRTYGEELTAVREVAEGYGVRFGLKPREENAAIILSNSPTWLEVYLAQSGAGVAVVPIDPKLPDFATCFFEKCGLSQCSRGPREKVAIILYDYISEHLYI